MQINVIITFLAIAAFVHGESMVKVPIIGDVPMSIFVGVVVGVGCFVGGAIFLIIRAIRQRRKKRTRVPTVPTDAGSASAKDNSMLSGMLKAEAERAGESDGSLFMTGSLIGREERKEPLVQLSLYDIEKIKAEAPKQPQDQVPLSQFLQKRQAQTTADPDSIPLSMISRPSSLSKPGKYKNYYDDDDDVPLSKLHKNEDDEDDIPLSKIK